MFCVEFGEYVLTKTSQIDIAITFMSEKLDFVHQSL